MARDRPKTPQRGGQKSAASGKRNKPAGRSKRQSRGASKVANGCIIICDVVKFSEKSEEEQLSSIDFLDRSFRDLAAKQDLPKDMYINCTGDGFLAVVPIGLSKGRDAREVSLRLCSSLIARCEKYKPTNGSKPLRVRFGIHKGDYRTRIHAFKGEHALGRGLNHAARVAAIGDASHVVVSEEFFQTGPGAGSVSPEFARRFTDAIQLSVKHDRIATIRLYKGEGDEVISQTTPRRVRLLQATENKILSLLTAFGNAMPGQLDIPRSELRWRMSVFLPAEKSLICSPFRVHWKDGQVFQRARTTYSIDKNTWEGVPGWVYVHDKARIVTHAPDPDTEWAAYLAFWQKLAVNLTAEKVGGWYRKPRALIVVPVRVRVQASRGHAWAWDKNVDPGGVLCVDVRHSLEGVDPDLVAATLRSLEARADELAWALLTRRSV